MVVRQESPRRFSEYTESPELNGQAPDRAKWHAIRCYVNQRVSPIFVVKHMAAFGMLESPAPQRWFVERCYEADFVHSVHARTLGDALYFRNLLQKLAKELSRDGMVMEDVLADAMGRADAMAASMEQTASEGRDWLHKSYFYGKKDDDGYAVVRIGSHVNMFAGSTGCFEWDAGYLLCEFMSNNLPLFQARVIIELGCGTGMATIVLAQLKEAGALDCGRIMCTDGDQETVDNCKVNLRANGIAVDEDGVDGEEGVDGEGGRDERTDEGGGACAGVSCSRWIWEDGYKGLGERQRSILESGVPVTMIGADLLYDPEIIPTIVPLIAEFLGHVHAESCVYLSTRRRSEVTMEKFLRAVDAEPTLRLEDVSGAFWAASRDDPSFVSFHHVPSLEDVKKSEGIILHRISSHK